MKVCQRTVKQDLKAPLSFLGLCVALFTCIAIASAPARAQLVLPQNGIITTVAGNGTAGYLGDSGVATSAELNGPTRIAVDAAGNIYIADSRNNVIRVETASTGIITTIVGNGTAGFSGDGGLAVNAELNSPGGIAVDSVGNLYIADQLNSAIRKVTVSTGVITTVAGMPPTPGYSGDGALATAALLSYPAGLTLDTSGNIYIADLGNNAIRKVTASTGIITTVAGNGVGGYSGDGGLATSAEFNSPADISVDSAGNLYIADFYNSVVREVAASSGIITTFAGNGNTAYTGDGGPATSASMGFPISLALDGAGNLYIGDEFNNVVRKVTAPTGIITTIVGDDADDDRAAGYSGDGGLATAAQLNSPTGLAAAPAGNSYLTFDLLLADSGNNVIRAVGGYKTASPTFSPISATYSAPQTVTISESLSGTTIYYTTDGSVPTTSSSVYSLPIVVSSSQTLNAIAVTSGSQLTAVGTAPYTITQAAPTVNFASGFTSSNLSLNEGAAIVANSLQLSDGGRGEQRTAWFTTPVSSHSFISDFNYQASLPTADGITFTLHNDPEGIYALGYDGEGLGYGGIQSSVAIKFDMYNNLGEGIDSTGFYVDGALPVLPAQDMTSSGVILRSGDLMHIHVTYDGTTLIWTISDTVTNASFTDSTAINIPSIVGADTAYVGLTGSTGTFASTQIIPSWTLISGSATTFAATPVFSPVAGTYSSARSVTISDSTPGATIYYTTDGTTPTTSSNVYMGPITVSATETLNAIAVATGYYNSSDASAPYTIGSGVTVSVAPASVTLYGGQSQQFSATVSGNADTAVSWSISPAGFGSVNSSGLYTAPSSITTQQTVTVSATSQADTTKSGSATITLTPGSMCSAFGFVRAIVIDHSQVPNTDQSNFPFLFNTTDPSFAMAANGGHVANANGYDIIFSSDPAGLNRLNFEMEKYDPVAGQIIAWIGLPTLSHTSDTVLYMFYGNSSITSAQQNPAGVWDSNYVGVWHVPNGNQLSLVDSTANGNNATDEGATAAAGQIDGGMQTNGTTYATIGAPANLANLAQGNATFSAWVNPSTPGGMIIGKAGFSEGGWTLGLDQNNELLLEVYGSDHSSISYPLASGWNFVVGTITNPGAPVVELSVYVNGALADSESGLNYSRVDDSSAPAYLANNDVGDFNDVVHSPLNGLEDEFRISNIARSPDWIVTEYNNQASPSTFYTLYAENFGGVVPSTTTLQASQSANFAAVSNCSTPAANWSMPAGSPGTLTSAGIYTAPSSISSAQSIVVTATGATSGTAIGTAGVHLFPPVAVSVTPLDPTLQSQTGTVQFAANVLNSSNTAVYWSLSSADTGTISASGLFQPYYFYSAETVTVTATSEVDPTKSASTTLTLAPVIVSPTSAYLYGGFPQQFTASVPVTWSISPSGAGTISNSGVFTGTTNISSDEQVTIIGTSQADPTASSTATIHLYPAATLSPLSPVVSSGQTLQFSPCMATAISYGSFSCDPTVATWSISPSGAGSITSSGLYSAPTVISSNQTVVVTATDTFNSAVVASATVTLSPPVITVSPATTTLFAKQGQQFLAKVTESPTTSVIWSISPLGVGSVSANGLYTAPSKISAQQSVTVTATSQFEPSVSSSAIVTLSPVQCAANAFNYVRQVIIDHNQIPNSDQNNFPFLLSVTDPKLATTANGGHMTSANGYDLEFSSDAAGVNRLDYELEEYNPATGQVVAWIRIPTLSHTSDTALFMFYGDSNIPSSQQNSAGVWDSNFTGVYHLANAAGGSVVDSTLQGNNSVSTAVTLTMGQIDGAASFNGSSSDLVITPSVFGSYPLLFQQSSSYPLTFGVWFKTSGPGVLLSQAVGSGQFENIGGNSTPALYVDIEGYLRASIFNLDGAPQIVTPTTVNDNQWHYAVVSLSNGTETLYVDGRPAGSDQKTYELGYGASYSYFIGAGDTGNTPGGSSVPLYFTGSIDEIEVSDEARSSDWELTEYRNQNSPSTFFTLTTEVSQELVALPASVSLSAGQSKQLAAQVTNTCTSSDVAWSMPAGSVGTLTETGLYTAPAAIDTLQTIALNASTLGTPSLTTSVHVTLLPPLSITVSPANATLTQGMTEQFVANVANYSSNLVNWSTSPTGIGSVDSLGVYTAPSSITVPQTINLTATSQADPTKSATATISLAPGGSSGSTSVSVSPGVATVIPGSQQQFTATVASNSNQGVTWSVNPAGIGSISAAGLYSAPSTITSQQTVTVTATSTADTSSSGSAVVSLIPVDCASSGYGYQRILVIDHTKVPNEDLSNFPFLFNSTDPVFALTANGGQVTNPNGYDIIFSTDPNGLTKLDHELEEYNPVTGQVVAWVRIPTLSHSTDTVLYVFYGNPNIAGSQQNPPGVWDSNYQGVYHLALPESGAANDSTGNLNSGTTSTVTSSSGKIDGAASLDGSSSFIELPGTVFPNFPTGAYDDLGLPQTATTSSFAATFGVWFKTSASGGILGQFPTQDCVSYVFGFCITEAPMSPGAADNSFAGWNTMLYVDDNGNLVGGGVFGGAVATPRAYNDNQWHLATVTYATDGTDTLYVDGQSIGSAQQQIPVGYSPNYSYFVGTSYTRLDELGNWSWLYFNGQIDDVTISNIPRSGNWIQTEYHNQSSPSTFYTLYPASTPQVVPSAASLYASQVQQFAATGACNATVTWSMSSGAPGTLSSSGLYTAPATVGSQQTVSITATSQGNGATIGSAAVTLLPTPSPFTLTAAVQPPYVTGTSQTFNVVLRDQDGSAEPGAFVNFSVTGSNSNFGSATTDNQGYASFTYPGSNTGTDTIQATAVVNGILLTSNSVSVSWTLPISQTLQAAVTLNTPPAIGLGGLVGAFTDSSGTVIEPIAIGASPESVVVPAGATQLQLGVDDNYFEDNGGSGFTVQVGSNSVTVPPTAMPWTWTTGGLNNNYQFGLKDGTSPVVAATGLTQGTAVRVAYEGGTVSTSYPAGKLVNANGDGALFTSLTVVNGLNYPTLYTTPASYPVGQPLPLATLVTNSAGAPASGVPVTLNVSGANPGQFEATTDSTGTVPFAYTGAYAGSDSLQAQAAPSGQSTLTSSIAGVIWSAYPTPPTPASIALSYYGAVNDGQVYAVLVTDASGNPIENANVGFYVTGVDNFQQSQITDITGHAAFSYEHLNAGNFSIVAATTINRNVILSNVINGVWTQQISTTNGGDPNTISIAISAPNTVTMPTALSLTGTVTDNIGITPTVVWSQVSGPGTVIFANPQQPVTTATFSESGNYVLELTGTDTGVTGSAQFAVTVRPNEPTVALNGWIGSPVYGSSVSGIVPITLAPGITLQTGTLVYAPANNLGNTTVLNANTTGSAQIGTLDTTTLANGTYWILLQSTQTNGQSEYDEVMITVVGNYKPGRVTAAVTDLVVPATGLAINIQRSYDSLNASTVGDFGYGWNLGTTVNLTVDQSNDVTFTLGGQRRTFYFAPQVIGFPFDETFAAYTAEPGFFGSLTTSGPGCTSQLDVMVLDGGTWQCIGGGIYNPPGYIYTDPSGTQYTISANGSLQSVTDRVGNSLTITPNGITSSTGLSVPFVRDSQNRITQITDTLGNQYLYSYDTNGNLATVTYPNTTQPSTYTYAANHYYTGGTDFRSNPLPVTAYYGPTDTDPNGLPLNGRLQSVTDSLNETSSYAYNLLTNTTTITYPQDASGNVGTATMVYDSYGMLLSSTDPLGHTTTNVYDSNHNLISVTDPLGHTTAYTYDANGNRTSEAYPATSTSTNTTSRATYNQYGGPVTYTDENGNTRNFSYDANGNLAAVTDTVNGQITTEETALYSSNGLLQALASGADLTKNPAAASTFTYDVNGNVATASNPLGKTTQYTYDAMGRVVSLVRNAGVSSTASVMLASNIAPLTARTTPQALLGNAERTATSSRASSGLFAGRPTAQTALQPHSLLEGADPSSSLPGCNPNTPSTYTVTYYYSAMYGVSSEVDSLGRSASATYDGNGNVITYTDANGNTYLYTYDALNRLTGIALPTHPATGYSFTYDYAGNVIDAIDAEGHDRHNVYDLAERLISATVGYGTASAATTTFSYNDDGTLSSTTDALGHTTSYGYDAAGNLIHIVKGSVSVQYAYDNARNRVSSTDGNGNVTSFQYDARKRLQQIGFADQTRQTINYDNANNVTSVVDQGGHTVDYGYNASNYLISVTQANSPYSSANTVNYCRDGFGSLSWSGDALGHLTSQTVDDLGRPTSLTFPDRSNGLTASYDGNSNILTLSKTGAGASRTATFAYDSLNRLTSETPDASYGEPAINLAYTANGLLSNMTDGSGSTLYSYDSLDRLVSKSSPAGTLNYTYDAAGNVASMNSGSSGRISVSYSYDDLNRLSTVVDNTLPTGQNTTTYSYDPTSNLATATYPNGLQAVFSYDKLNRLSETATPVSAYQYQRDANGNILTATEANNRTVNYTYDGIDELTGETVSSDPSTVDGSVSYSLSPVGNRLSDLSTLGPVDPSSATFNADDQLQSETYDASGDTVATGGNSYAYNSWLRLSTMNGGQVALNYNGLGQLVSKTVGGVTTQYLIDDLSPTGYPQVVEELVNGEAVRSYTYGLERINELQTINGTQAASFYQYDGRGTVRMLTNSAGAVTDTYEYDAFGNEIAQTGTTPNAYFYRGERYDSDLGLYYLRARWYNPLTGRFMTRDPYEGSIYDPASLHRYNYARANPVSYIDPSGRASALEYADVTLTLAARGAVATAVGIAVKCMYYTLASAQHLVDENIGQQFGQFSLLFNSCAASVNVTQFATAWAANTALLGLGDVAGWAIGKWLYGAEQGTTVLYHGTSHYAALEMVENQGFNIERLTAHQIGKGYSSGLYTTTQGTTADWFSQAQFASGRAGGPAIVQIEIPTSQLNNFLEAYDLTLDSPLPQSPVPGMTELFIPIEALEDFNGLDLDISILELP